MMRFNASWPSQVDRSACGSGTTARMALQYARGLIEAGQTRTFTNSKTQSHFVARIVEVLPEKGHAREAEGRDGKGDRVDAAECPESRGSADMVLSKTVKQNWPKVVVEVKGNAYYTGTATFSLEEDDALKGGFLIK